MDCNQPSAVTLFSQRPLDCQITAVADATFVTTDLHGFHRV